MGADAGSNVVPIRPLPAGDCLAGDDDLDAGQLATMDSIWRARRKDGISGQDAAELERLVRSGHVGSARYWLGRTRRAARELRRATTDPEGRS